MLRLYYLLILLTCNTAISHGRRHKLIIKNDSRNLVLCSRFGYAKESFLSVDVQKLEGDIQHAAFTLRKATNNGLATSYDVKPTNCPPKDDNTLVYLFFDQVSKTVLIKHAEVSPFSMALGPLERYLNTTLDVHTFEEGTRHMLQLMPFAANVSVLVANKLITTIHISPELKVAAEGLNTSGPFNYTLFYSLLREATDRSMKQLTNHLRSYKTGVPVQNSAGKDATDEETTSTLREALPRFLSFISSSGKLQAIPYQQTGRTISVQFSFVFQNTAPEGLYKLYFHNCAEVDVGTGRQPAVNLTIEMIERNPTSFLSVGEQPLPILYSTLCAVYFLLSSIWFIYLRVSKNQVYRIHYLMLAVILVKALSLVFHGINYYVIGKHGFPEEGWAVMYYITHIIRGALLFITILLIGAGWAFIKHMLTAREKNVFLIVIPLQILANIATVVIEESEAGAARYATWKEILIFVDLACCIAILVPVVWSIRHLQQASQTDGKAALSLRKLRLFRHFYILVICYVYFTRVIVYLLNITVPFSLVWLVELFKESVTVCFLVAIGVKFRPMDDNPYLLVPTDEEDTLMERFQMEEVWSQSGAMDGVTRLSRGRSANNRRPKNMSEVGVENEAFSLIDDQSDTIKP